MEEKQYALKNRKTLIIKEATEDYAEEIIQVKQKYTKETDYLSYEIYDISIETQKDYIRRWYNAKNSVFFIAILDNKIVGDIAFTSDSRQKIKHLGEMGIYVLKEYWGIGIGSKLMEHFINWFNECDELKKIELNVIVDNKQAVKLYKKYGFRIEGVRENAFKINGEYQDMFLMGLIKR